MTKCIALLLAALFIPTFAHANEVATHDHLVILIDGSGSMDGSIDREHDGEEYKKMNVAKRAIINALESVPSSTWIGIYVFSDGFTGWLHPLGSTKKDELQKKILSIQESGGTPLGSTIKTAADALLDARKRQHNYGTYQLLVVTDGEASGWGEENKMNTYAPEVANRGIQLNVIGVGMKEQHKLATMAHRYWGANDPIALNKALQTAIQVETANADAAQADYDLLKGVPDDVAKAWLAEVTNMDFANWPIGEQKPISPPPAGANTQADPQATQQAQGSNQGKQKGCSAGTHGVNPVPTGLMTLLLIGLVALRRRSQMARVRIK
jgi:uncharacterized protein (TIGR03382 family)